MVVRAMGDAVQAKKRSAAESGGADEGYMLLGLIVAIAVLLLWLGAAATYEAFQIRRDREVEAARRADQYVRAIRLYYKKFGHYPGSIEQLDKSNNIRFLRRRWVDPLTKTADWRLISVGQNKTTVKGFFGEPLAGLPTSGLGALAGSQSAGMSGPTAAGPGGTPGAFGSGAPGGLGSGSPGGLGAGSPGGTGMFGGGTPGAAAAGATGLAAGSNAAGAASGTATSSSSGTSAGGANSPFGAGNGLGGTNGAIMGVGTNATGSSILEVNEQTSYQDWEFLYDPRVELLKQKQQLNQGLQTTGAGSFGQQPGFGTTPTSGPGAPSGNAPAAPNNNLPGGNENQQNPPANSPTTQPTVGVPVQQ